MERFYKNTGNYFLILILFIALGFYYPYFSLFPQFEPITTTVHIHAISLMLWTLILITQPILIRYKKYKAHKTIGKVTYFLIPVVVLTCAGVMRQQYYDGIERKLTSAQSLKALFVSFTQLFSIIIFYILAIVNVLKGNIAFHMRYMICLFFQFIPPTFGRTLGYWLGLSQVYTNTIAVLAGVFIIIMLIVADKRRKTDFTPYVVALSLYFLFNVSWFVLGCPL